MRLAALLLALAACGASRGPSWPKSAGTERLGEAADDGGESLEPRVPSEVAAIEAGGQPASEPARVDKPEVRTTSAAPSASDAAAPASTGDTPQLIELTEEIIITDDP